MSTKFLAGTSLVNPSDRQRGNDSKAVNLLEAQPAMLPSGEPTSQLAISRLAKLKAASLSRRGPVAFSSPRSSDLIAANRQRVEAADEIAERIQSHAAEENLPYPSEALAILGLAPALDASLGHSHAQSPAGMSPPPCTSRLGAIRALLQDVPADSEQLARRLRSVTIKLAFHVDNAARVQPAPRPRPWLPGTVVTGSKHKGAPTATEKLKRQLETHRPSPQESELQIKLLSALRRRLELKMGLAAFRRAVAVQRLRLQLINQAQQEKHREEQREVLALWHNLISPAEEFRAPVAAHVADKRAKTLRCVFRQWQNFAAKRMQLKNADICGQKTLKNRLLAAALAHWKLWSALQQVDALQSALATGWLDLWQRRKALLAWRRSARRTRLQREALLRASSPHSHHKELTDSTGATIDARPPLPSAMDGLAGTREMLAGLRACVATLLQELPSMRQGLRWRDFSSIETMNHGGASTVVAQRPEYDPAAYSSPRKLQQRSRESVAVEAAAVELFLCRSGVKNTEQEVETLRAAAVGHEGTLAALDIEIAALEDAYAAAHGAASRALREVDEAESSAERLQQNVSAVHAECSAQEAALETSMQEAASCRTAATVAQASLESAHEESVNAEKALELWKRKVAAAAMELEKAKPPNRPAAVVKLKEARRRLEHEQHTLQQAQKELPALLQAAEQAAEHAYHANSTLHAVQQASVNAAAQKGQVECELNAAIAHRDACISEAEGIQAEAGRAESALQTALTAHSEISHERDTCWQQLFTRERELAMLQDRVVELEERHAVAIAAALDEAYPAWHDVAPLALSSAEFSALHEERQPGGRISSPTESESVDPMIPPTTAATPAAAESIESLFQSVDSTPQCSPRKMQCFGVTGAAMEFHRISTLRRAFHAMREEAGLWRELHVLAVLGYRCAHLPSALSAWRVVTEEASCQDENACEVFRLSSCFRQWAHWARIAALMRHREHLVAVSAARRTMLKALFSLQSHAAREQRHAEAMAAVAHRRAKVLLRTWRIWAQKHVTQRILVQNNREKSDRVCLKAALLEWRTEAHNTALLRRVFNTACDLWRQRIGAAGYEAEFASLQRSFSAWQLGVHAVQEERRDGMLGSVADTLRRRHLAATALRALQQHVIDTRELEAMLPMRRAVLLAWHLEVERSPEQVAMNAARMHRARRVLRTVLATWRECTEKSALRVSQFIVQWHVDRPLRAALNGWRMIAQERRRWEARWAQAVILQQRNSVYDSPSSSDARSAKSIDRTIVSKKTTPPRRTAAAVYFTPGSSKAISVG